MGYGKHVEDKDQWVGSFNSKRGLGKWPKEWIPREVSRKEEDKQDDNQIHCMLWI